MKGLLSITLILVSIAFFGVVVINSAVAHEGESIVEEITTADLGVENPGLLPTNPFYFFKEWSRGIKMFFTFNGVSKAEYELKIVNRKAAELKKIQEARPDDVEALKKALGNYSENVIKLKNRLQSLEETSENPNVDKLLNGLVDRAMKHKQLFEELKAKHEELHEEVDDVEDDLDEVVRHVVEDIDKPEKAGERLEKAIKAQKESQTKELRAVKFLSNLEEDVDSSELIKKLAQVKAEQVKNIEIKLSEGSINLSQIEDLIDKLTTDQPQKLNILIELRERTENMEFKNKLEMLEDEVLEDTEEGEESMVCTQQYDPVCGADGKTYSNSCFAGLAKVQTKYKGVCGKPESESGDSIKLETTPQINISPDSIKVETDSGATVIVSRVWNIGITDEGFSSAELKIRKGDTVVWANKGSKSSWPASAVHPTHSIYPEKGGCIGSAFDACKGLSFGETFKFVFNQVGSWKYHNHLNTT